MLDSREARTPDDRLIADLMKHPGWPEWRESVERDVERKILALARKWLFTDEPVDALEIEKERRYLKGRLDVVKQPHITGKKLEREGTRDV